MRHGELPWHVECPEQKADFGPLPSREDHERDFGHCEGCGVSGKLTHDGLCRACDAQEMELAHGPRRGQARGAMVSDI